MKSSYKIFGITAVIVFVAALSVTQIPSLKERFWGAESSGSYCPKISQASLNVGTQGCPSTFSSPVSEARTYWQLEKTAVTDSPLMNPQNSQVLYDVKVTQGPDSHILMLTGQLQITNSGQQIPTLESVIANLQTKSAGTKFSTTASAVAVKAVACRDNQGIEGGLTCFGNFTNSPGASLALFDPNNNDPIALSAVPIPPIQDPLNPCSSAVIINYKAEFDLDQLNLAPGAGARLELLTTFAGAGPRGKSPDSVSCTKDVNCSGAIDGDIHETCQINESETDNVRTVATRNSFAIPAFVNVCPSVTKTDNGASSLDSVCLEVSSNTLNSVINKQYAGFVDIEQVIGTASCVNGACSTDVTNTAEINCVDGRNELISGSPASASVQAVCEEEEEEIAAGDFCTRTQGCWGQPGNSAPCRSLLLSSFANTYPGGLFIGEGAACPTNNCGKSGTLDGGGDNTFAAKWTTANAIRDYLPAIAIATSGTLSADLTNPESTSSGVFDAQLTAAELNVGFNDAGALLLTGSNSQTKLGDLKYQACSGFVIATALQGKTIRQVIDAADRVASGEFGIFTGPGAPSQSVTIPGFGTVTIDELKTALDALNNNFDNCEANLGCFMLP